MIVYRVQHHPARAHLLPRLLHRLSPLQGKAVEHFSQPPDPWAGYKKCLQIPCARDVSHVLIIQDDAIPVDGFTDVLPRIAEENPSSPVCLWMGAAPASASLRARRAYGKQRYVPLGATPFVPLVAVLWPRDLPQRLLDWAADNRSMTRADDGNVARWARNERVQFMVTVPSLVEHDDFTPTVKGGRPETQGRDRNRVAMLLAANAHEWATADGSATTLCKQDRRGRSA